jgi:hypothetical protein
MLIRLEGDNTFWSWHLDGGIGSVDGHHELEDERPPQDTIVPDIETGHLKCQHLPTLVFP